LGNAVPAAIFGSVTPTATAVGTAFMKPRRPICWDFFMWLSSASLF
jgi:hypothetical protein